MAYKKLFIILIFLYILLWGVANVKKMKNRIQFDKFNRAVTVEVVDLPLCGRTNHIIVEYNEKNYRVSVNKNDCIQGKFQLGEKLNTIYNPKLDVMNPYNSVGLYRTSVAFLIFVFIVFLGFLLNNRIENIGTN